jgi:cell pole-organizing protein PopZ
VRDEEKESLFRALNEVRDLMQREEVENSSPSSRASEVSGDNIDVLELAGHEIHEAFVEDQLDQDPHYILMDEISLEDDMDPVDTGALMSQQEVHNANENRDFAVGMGDRETMSLLESDVMNEVLDRLDSKSSEKTLENDIDLEMLIEQTARPYIIKWLDSNLESVVRDVVENEVGKILKKARRS